MLELVLRATHSPAGQLQSASWETLH